MRVPILPLPMIAAVALAGCASTPAQTARRAEDAAATQAKLDRALAGLVPGKPKSCLDQYLPSQIKAYGSTIIYKVSNRLKYRTDTGGGCEGIARGDILVTQIVSGRLCSGDIAQTVEPVSRFHTGSCSLGEFTAYTAPGR